MSQSVSLEIWGPAVTATIITLLVGTVSWIYRQCYDYTEKKKKRLNTAYILVEHLKQAVGAFDRFLPDFEKDVDEFLTSQTPEPFFVPATDSLTGIIKVLDETLLLLPPDVVSKMMLFYSYDISLNELLRDISHQDFPTLPYQRKKKVIEHIINLLNGLSQMGKVLIEKIEAYKKDEKISPWGLIFSKMKRLFLKFQRPFKKEKIKSPTEEQEDK